MLDNSKSMLGLQEDILRKADGLTKYDGKYFDKHDEDANGKPTEKLYVPGSLRIAPLLNASKLVREDDRVADIYRAIETELEAGNRQLMDELKNRLTVHAKNIAEQEIKARKRLQAIKYFETAVEIAGSRAIVEKRSSGFQDFKSKIEHLAYAIVSATIMLLDEKHIDALLFVEEVESNFDEASDQLWKDFQAHYKIKYDLEIKPLVHSDDTAIIDHVAKDLAKILPALTTELWQNTSKAKVAAALDAELEEFLGRNELDHACEELGRAMEVDDEPIEQIVEAAVGKKLRKHLAQKDKQKRKNYSGNAANQESMPNENGQNGKRGSRERQQKQRGRSKKRSSETYNDEESYESQDGKRSKSRLRHKKDLPRSILKNGVNWHRSLSADKDRDSNSNFRGRGRGGRGRGRGGQGRSSRGGRGRGGGRK
jgi:hypothetical protein